MLDTIIEQSKYGSPHDSIENKAVDYSVKIIADGIKGDLENKMNEKLTEAIKDLKLSEIEKSDIEKSIKNTSINYNDLNKRFKLPSDLKNSLERFKEFPAHYILLRGIILSNSKSKDDIGKNVDKYSIPKGWDNNVIEKFIKMKILEGTPENFYFPKEFIIPLQYWVIKNKSAFDKIIAVYKFKKNNVVTDAERKISIEEIQF